jgi:hypothetical protein
MYKGTMLDKPLIIFLQMNTYLKLLVLFISISLLSSCADENPLDPEAPDRDKFLGNWKVKELVGGSESNYLAIVKIDSSNTAGIKIGNIYNLGASENLKALVAGNSVSISQQTITGITITGNGLFSGSQFILNYTANEGSGPQSVQATYSR